MKPKHPNLTEYATLILRQQTFHTEIQLQNLNRIYKEYSDAKVTLRLCPQINVFAMIVKTKVYLTDGGS